MEKCHARNMWPLCFPDTLGEASVGGGGEVAVHQTPSFLSSFWGALRARTGTSLPCDRNLEVDGDGLMGKGEEEFSRAPNPWSGRDVSVLICQTPFKGRQLWKL